MNVIRQGVLLSPGCGAWLDREALFAERAHAGGRSRHGVAGIPQRAIV